MTSTPKIVPLNKEQHADTKINNNNAFSHISSEHMLPVVVHEFVVAGAEFPIVFVKNSENNTYQPVVMLGLSAKQNLFMQGNEWQALYVPRAIRNYPLVLVKDKPDGDRLMVALDEASERINQAEGNPLFNEDGSESEFLAHRKQQMAEYVDMGLITRNFVEKLQSLLAAAPRHGDSGLIAVARSRVTVGADALLDDVWVLTAPVGIGALASAEAALQWTLDYTRERKAFGKAVADFQNTRFKLAEMATEIQIGRVFLDRCLELHLQGKLDVPTAAMLKYWGTDLQCKVLDECVQLHGGYGYMWEYPVARAWADARVQRIYAGTNEIMKEIIARSL